ncbi:hypothetical protein STRAU_6807 [Streptomyces aurantiacus JA 4570]|uniref:Uncharacterized protein n=1 Tax=Streptomyces aurantiacus JA 4570 TaxID=1286094 RepID=S3ZP68_9ACTN|nr:hypothetical protein STRAU_6807 [Streptomyces aurantiacus JA 4570]
MTSEFAEYVDPYTGAGCGARGFSWSAALALDLSVHGDVGGRGDVGVGVGVHRDTTAGPGSDEGARND